MTAKMNVTDDRTTRVIEIAVDLDPGDMSMDLEDYSATWRTKPRPFQPGRIRIAIDRGEFRSITVSGPLRLKGDRLSESLDDSMTWAPGSYQCNSKMEDAPEWVRVIAAEAPRGVTSWSFLNRSNEGEVQAL